MTELMQGLIAVGILGTFSALAGVIAIKVSEYIIDEYEKNEEKDYVYMGDGTPVEYNEEDQE